MSDISPLVAAQQKFIAAVTGSTITSAPCPLAQAYGHTLAKDITAATDMPPYHRAIVEGFVVNTAETRAADEDSPVAFTISGEVKPGDTSCPAIGSSQAIRVSTGSILPDGEISVVRMWEAKIDASGKSFTINRPFPPRFFIEDKGCDLKQGAVAVKKGTRLAALDIGTIASLGIDTVEACHHPVVTVFSSGDEVIPFTDPLTPGAIRDSNSIMLAAAVNAAGATAKIAGIMKDDFDAFVSAVKQELTKSDMVLISGGTAIGDRDFISDLVSAVGELIIDGVQMKSGRPLIMGIAGNKPLVCVAGHPPEALRGFNLFGVPALNKLVGNEDPLPEDDAPTFNGPPK
jgi:molybdenum cofactor synthesis domain-containing protein